MVDNRSKQKHRDLNLSEETKKYLRHEFSLRDTENVGFISTQMLNDCLVSVGITVLEEDLQHITKHFDTNGDGHLSVEELVESIPLIHAHALNRDELMKAFALFDVEKKGFIRLPHMLKILTHKGFMEVHEAREYLDLLCKKYDKNFDGRFDYGEFIQMFLGEEKLAENFGKSENDEDK